MKEKFINVVKGEIRDISTCSDEMFANKTLGDGILIVPKDDIVVSPCDGEVISIFPTKHAISIVSDSGVEILIHIGIDTVELEGEGFEQIVRNHAKVFKSDPLMKVNYTMIQEKGYDPSTLMVFISKTKIQKYHLDTVTKQYITIAEMV